jgi:hypothetical protein
MRRAPRIRGLTNQQRAICRLLAQGYSVAEIARRLRCARSSINRIRNDPRARDYIAKLRDQKAVEAVGFTTRERVEQLIVEAVAEGNTDEAHRLRQHLETLDSAGDLSAILPEGRVTDQTDTERGVRSDGAVDSPWAFLALAQSFESDQRSGIPWEPEVRAELETLRNRPVSRKSLRVVEQIGANDAASWNLYVRSQFPDQPELETGNLHEIAPISDHEAARILIHYGVDVTEANVSALRAQCRERYLRVTAFMDPPEDVAEVVPWNAFHDVPAYRGLHPSIASVALGGGFGAMRDQSRSGLRPVTTS